MDMHDLNELILKTSEAEGIARVDSLQSLWSGYGTIDRVHLSGGKVPSVILKHIKLGEMRGQADTVSHRRKLTSYRVEIEWYKRYSPRCDGSCRVPAYLASAVSDDALVVILEDLDAAGFPLRRYDMSRQETDACLFWLASFHAAFLNEPPEGLWDIGTYWHLGTRGEELRAMPKGPLKKKAHRLDDRLRNAAFQTLVHGDAKPENFCFSKDGWVAAVDFQYVGRGCGMKDVAYFLWGTPAKQAEVWVDTYFDHLGAALRSHHPGIDFEALKTEWQTLYPVACDDFERFLKGWLVLR